jgi:hypothetical protein
MLNDLKVVSERLAAWLCARGETGVEVLALQRTSGGFMSWHPRSCASTGLPVWTASPRWPGWERPALANPVDDRSLGARQRLQRPRAALLRRVCCLALRHRHGTHRSHLHRARLGAA